MPAILPAVSLARLIDFAFPGTGRPAAHAKSTDRKFDQVTVHGLVLYWTDDRRSTSPGPGGSRGWS